MSELAPIAPASTSITTAKPDKIELTQKQTELLERAVSFAESGDTEEYFVGAGLAGTGKTTTMVETLRALRDAGFRPRVCAPTGKATFVINQKQKEFRASTIHKALTKHPYDGLAQIHSQIDVLHKLAQDRPLTPEEITQEAVLFEQLEAAKGEAGALSFEPIDPEEFYAAHDLLVFDESSMIGKMQIYDKLISPIKVPKLFFGDDAQLPPVLDTPAVDFRRARGKLTQILRQGADSGILHFAHGIHSGRVMTKAELKKYDDVTIVNDDTSKVILPFATDHQIVCWMNKERHRLNPAIRQLLGFDFKKQMRPEWPMPGEKLMVDQNDEDRLLLKGQIMTVISVMEHPKYPMNSYLCMLTCIDENGVERTFPVTLTDMCPSVEKFRELGMELEDSSHQDKKSRWVADKVGIQMMYSYAITAHKAQGSEWDKVLVVGSMIPQGNGDWQKWWYTAVTRARSELVIASYYFAHDHSA